MKNKKQKIILSHHTIHILLRILLWALGILTSIALLAVLIIWVLWPIRDSSLQKATPETMTFQQAKNRVETIKNNEVKEGVKPDCLTKLYTHPTPTKRSVFMIHGISACPRQFDGLAQYFYNQGYNVYVGRVPHHGLVDNVEHSKVTTKELVGYVNDSVNIAKALGQEVGVVGLSGGGNLATWAAEYRPEVKRIVTLSPFYEPSLQQAPKWQLRPLMVLYGSNLVKDSLNKPDDPQHALSYYALAKYSIIFNNFKKEPDYTGLQRVGVIMADDDLEIDQPLAVKTLTALAKANHTPLLHEQIPGNYKLGHDIVNSDNAEVAKNQSYLYEKYFSTYNN